MKTKMLIMRPEEPNETREIELVRIPNYETLRDLLQPILDCKYPEHVTVLADFAGGMAFRRSDMFVDEDGHRRKRPRNGNATDIYRRNAILNQGAKDPEALEWIAGPAVLFNRIVWT